MNQKALDNINVFKGFLWLRRQDLNLRPSGYETEDVQSSCRVQWKMSLEGGLAAGKSQYDKMVEVINASPCGRFETGPAIVDLLAPVARRGRLARINEAAKVTAAATIMPG